MKVSVIIPVYNAEKYLAECLDSIVCQTLSDIEIICVNDGSSDNSLSLLEAYSRKDNRFKIINQENSGPGVARNTGINVASGEYIFFVDSDDTIFPETLEKMYNKASSLDLDICVCRSYEYNIKTQNQSLIPLGAQLPKEDVFSSSDISDSIFLLFGGWPWDKLYKSSLIKDNNISFPNLKNSEDTYFVYKSLILSNRISLLNDFLILHKMNITISVSKTRESDCDAFIKSMDLLRQDLLASNKWDIFKKCFVSYFMIFALWHLQTISESLKDTLLKSVKNYIQKLKIKKTDFVDKYSYSIFISLQKSENYKHFEKLMNNFNSFWERIFSVKNSKNSNHKVITILGLRIKIRKPEKENIKILIALHKPALLPKGKYFLPVHVGRDIAQQKSKDGIIKKKDLSWLLQNTVGDNTGDNISSLNRYYNECSALYWAWKNYDKIGNPDYIGLNHYRRYFCFNDGYFDSYHQSDYEKGLCFIPENRLTSKVCHKVGLTDKSIEKVCKNAEIIVTRDARLDIAYQSKKTNLRGDYETSLSGCKVKDFDLMINIVLKKYPQYTDVINKKINGYEKSLYQLIIMKREIFFEYCSFLFAVLEEINNKVDFSDYTINGQRTLGYLAEILLSIYIWDVEEKYKYKISKYGTLFIQNTDLNKPILKSIFAVENSLDKRHKVVTVLGLKFKFKRGKNK